MFIPIISVMGYSTVMKLIGSEKHLVNAVAKPLKKSGIFMLSGVTIVIFLMNTSLTSPAGLAAATGAIFIPLLVTAGYHPALVGAAIMAGTFGQFFNPGNAMNVLNSEIAGVSVTDVIAFQAPVIIISLVISIVVLNIIGYLRKEHKGHSHLLNLDNEIVEGFKVNWVKALLPLLPIILIFSTTYIPGIPTLSILESILISLIVSIIVTKANVGEAVTDFFKGAGGAFGSIFGILVTGLVFSAGMERVGLIDLLTDGMIAYPAVAKIAAAVGPWALAVLTGSGEAATTAFNTAVTVNAGQFGVSVLSMGSVAALAGAFGRTMSPLAGASIILGKYGKVDSFEISKRIAPGMIIVLIITTILLFFVF